jgi:hypothetical protein
VSAAGLAARAVELLGRVDGPVAIACPVRPGLAAALATRLEPAHDGAAPQGAVIVFLGLPARPAERQAMLQTLLRRLVPHAPLVLVDHNQPRAWWRRLVGWLALAADRASASRARYPAARELAALGFTVERLELACGERVQLVRARVRSGE